MEAVAILIAIGRLHLADANDCFNNDLDSYGNDIGSAIKDVSSAAACQKLCNSNADCNYFTYGKTVYSGNCWLKSKKMIPLTSAPGLISGPKTCPKFDPCLLQDKYLGGYAGGARNAFSTMENAMAECLRVDDCGGLTYEQTPAEWTLRVQTTPKQSPSQEISILRTCYEKPDLICHDLYQHSDVGFIMDISGSVGGHWADEKRFVMDLVRRFDLFPNGAHAAVTTFDDTASLGIKFSDHTTTDDFEVALESLPFTGGYTEIGVALDVALNEMFQKVNGMRLDSPKVAVLITDGKSNSEVDYAGFQNLFRGAHIKLLVVGIGNVNENGLLELVETPEDLLLVTDFAALDVTDFVEHTTFCEPDACACEAPLRQKLDQMNSKLDLLTEMLEAIGNHVVPVDS